MKKHVKQKTDINNKNIFTGIINEYNDFDETKQEVVSPEDMNSGDVQPHFQPPTSRGDIKYGDDFLFVPPKVKTVTSHQYEDCFMKSYIMTPVINAEMDERDILPELDVADAKLPSDIEMFDQVRNDICIIRVSERTMVYAIVVDKEDELNKAVGIRCYNGIAFGGYVRDCSSDAYLVECVESIHLGTVPFSIRLEIPKSGGWTVGIPIPERVLFDAFAPQQRKNLSNLKERFLDDRYEIHFLQMLMA